MDNETKELINIYTEEKVYSYELANGLKVFVCPTKDYKSKIGMLGTVYGSIDNDFVDIRSGIRKKVPDGIAHFLEHKLFEQEGGNALDLFSKMGVSSNAYTSIDHTVYFFETTSDFNECLKTLFSFVTSPYFTDENVEKEKGIISQELKMYDDDPNAVAYYTTLKGMYQKLPLKVDIGGTQDSISKITKEMLYTCYSTFYNPKNMFCIIIGDIDKDEAIKRVSIEYATALEVVQRNVAIPVRFYEEEPKEVAHKTQEKRLDVYLPLLTLGFKQPVTDGRTSLKNGVITEIINQACFSNVSTFYEKLYEIGLINEPIEIAYESGKNFAHVLCMGASTQIDKLEGELLKYIEELKSDGMSQEMFDIAKNRQIGEAIFESEEIMNVHRAVINSIIQKTQVYDEENTLFELTLQDVNEYIKQAFNTEQMTITRVLSKK